MTGPHFLNVFFVLIVLLLYIYVSEKIFPSNDNLGVLYLSCSGREHINLATKNLPDNHEKIRVLQFHTS